MASMSTPPLAYPPKEIPLLAQLCWLGDLDEPSINTQFLDGLKAFKDAGHSLRDLWPVVLSAVESARPGVIKLLLSRGLEMNEMYIKKAVQTRSKDVFQGFIDCGWDVNARWDKFHPPVLACFVNDPEFVRWFPTRGADPDAACYLDITPLSFAVRRAQPETVKYLLDRGNIEKGQLVHHAVERSDHAIEVLEMLVSKGAYLDKIQYSDHMDSWNHEHFKGLGTPLHRAVELGNVEVVRYLRPKGADLTIQDTRGRTPLDIAKDGRMIELLTGAPSPQAKRNRPECEVS